MEQQKIYEVHAEKVDNEIAQMQELRWRCIGRIDNDDSVIHRFER